MSFTLKPDHELFKALAKKPLWWENLKRDKDLYIDIRKGNHINVYFNGGSLMELSWKQGYSANVHRKYVPLQPGKKTELPYGFSGNEVFIPNPGLITIDNFNEKTLRAFKERIKKHFSNSSEKGIQGSYVTTSRMASSANGFFIDTEFAYGISPNKSIRIDLVWVDIKSKRIAFVELKTISDSRLKDLQNPKSIVNQIESYKKFIQKHSAQLLKYYDTLYQIRHNLGINPVFATEASLVGYTVLDKPILLVGDCSKVWIAKNAPRLNQVLTGSAYGCRYRGKGSSEFRIPDRNYKNDFKLP